MTTTTLTTIELRPYLPSAIDPPRSPPPYPPSSREPRYTLPPLISPSSSTYVRFSITRLAGLAQLSHHNTILTIRAAKFVLAALATLLTLISGWWALDLAMYQATASFQQTCLQQMQTFNRTVGVACDEVVEKSLEGPRVWRSFFGTARNSDNEGSGALVDRSGQAIRNESELMVEERGMSWWTTWKIVKHSVIGMRPRQRHAYCSRDEVKGATEKELENTKSSRSRKIGGRCHPLPKISRIFSPDYRGSPEDLHCFGLSQSSVEMARREPERWEYFREVGRTCIQKEADQPMLYGRLPSCNCQPLTSFEDCWFDGERAMCESTLCSLFDYCDDGTNLSHANAMSRRRLDIMRSFFDDMDETALWMTFGISSISSSKQWEMNDSRLLGALVVTVLVIQLVDKIVRRRTSGW